MVENTTRKICFRLFTQFLLVGGILFFATDHPQFKSTAYNCGACDSAYPVCNNTCSPSNAVPCYGNCQNTYASCLWDCGDEYSRTPMYNYNASCWENAESVYNHCLVGQMPSQGWGAPDYETDFANCMVDFDNDVYTCCYYTQQSWWGYNGPYCY